MFVVYDLETTGLSTFADDIVQFSYIRFDDNNMPVQSETLYFYYEGMSWSAEAEAVHHISRDFLKNYADKFEENVIKMYSILSLANVVGFNSDSFDNAFARNWLSRMGMSNLQLGLQKDIMLLARPVVKRPKISLIKLCERLGITPEIIRSFEKLCYKTEEGTGPHNASYDVSATALCALKFLNEGYMTWSRGKTDITKEQMSGDVYGNDFIEDETAELPEDPNGFWMKLTDHYEWVVTEDNMFASKEPVSDIPDGLILCPVDTKYVNGVTHVFEWCSLRTDVSGKLHIDFDNGGTFAYDTIEFSSLLKQLAEESIKRR